MIKYIIILITCLPLLAANCYMSRESFTDGNVWKPEADHTGNLVVILRGSYPVFKSCEVKKKKNRGYDSLTYSGLANGDRHHWRADKPGRVYAGKKQRGGVYCYHRSKAYFFPLRGAAKKRYD